MYGYHTDTLYELRPTSCTDVLRRCVRIAPTYANEGSLYVITGPIYKGSITAIGNGVLVPTMVYKIIYSPKQKKSLSLFSE